MIDAIIYADEPVIENHSFSTYAKYYEQLTFVTPYTHTCMCAYQGVKNVNF